MDNKPTVILIAGPTASGKSALALKMAEDHNGVIVNADAMQVYSTLEVLTARPDKAALARAEHRLYGHVSPAISYSVAQWLSETEIELKAIQDQGKTPIFTGGTGLYFKALIEGLSDIPDPDSNIRAYWRNIASQHPEILHDALLQRDPVSARKIRRSDSQRLVRALEIYDSTGKSLSYWQQRGPRHGLLSGQQSRKILVIPPREILHARISQRFDQMLAEGAIEEVTQLQAMKLSPQLPAMKAIGVRPLLDYIEGRITLETVIAQSKAATRQYAKRQITWFRHQSDDDWENASQTIDEV
jgi:tRNA dimethylallyltransferase